MIRSLSRPQTLPCSDFSVCSLSWSDRPGQARLLPPNINTEDGVCVPLQHIPLFPCTGVRVDNRLHGIQSRLGTARIFLDDNASIKAEVKPNRMTARRDGCLTGRVSSGGCAGTTLCTSCESRMESSRTPDAPTVSPCSSSDVTSGSSSPVSDDMDLLLTEVTSRLPCIETGQSIMMAWTDIREVFFPRCSATDCNIVVNALKLQLKYPHIPQFMHACTSSEQMTFLKRHLHLVAPGTFLVDVEVFLKHRESLLVMVETKHLVTADTRSIGCNYNQQPHRQQQDWIQWDPNDRKQKPNGHLLPAVVAPSNTRSLPGDGSIPQEAVVPLSMLPLIFPRYHRQLLLMATGFITGKDKRRTRKCSQGEAKVLNMWHRSIKGSNNQLVTSGDLLVKWADVVVIVDPQAKHAARVSSSQQQQQQLQRQQHPRLQKLQQQPQVQHNELPSSTSRNTSRPSTSHPQSRDSASSMKEVTVDQAGTEKSVPDISAENWMPQILNCYSTAGPVNNKLTSVRAPTTSPKKKGRTDLAENVERKTAEMLPASSSDENSEDDRHKANLETRKTSESSNKCSNKKGESLDADEQCPVQIIQTEVHVPGTCHSSSSSSCDSNSDTHHSGMRNNACRHNARLKKAKEQRITDVGNENESLEKHLPVSPIRNLSIDRSEPETAESLQKSSTYQSKPRKCKGLVSRSGTRRSERIANQAKESETGMPDNRVEGAEAMVKSCKGTDVPPNKHQGVPSKGKDAEQSSANCGSGYLDDESDAEASSSGTSSGTTESLQDTGTSSATTESVEDTGTGSGTTEGVEDTGTGFGTTECVENTGTSSGTTTYLHESPGRGFRNIADLFSVLSNEEVSHRSRQLATDEIVVAMKKSVSVKPRNLGDLSSKGLDFSSLSDVRLQVQRPQQGSDIKVSQKDENADVPQVIGKNRNEYPDLLLKAQKCSVQKAVPTCSKQHCGIQVSVTEIMKSMDKTFNAFKSDPVELIKAKMRASKTPTGYVNTDYIRITSPGEKPDLLKHPKSGLPPIDRYGDESRRNTKHITDISAILRNHSPMRKFSLLDPTFPSPKQHPVSQKVNVENVQPSIDSTCSTKDRNCRTKSLTEDTIVSGACPTDPTDPHNTNECQSLKPNWNIKKMITTPKSITNNTSNDKRKTQMNVDFHKMRAKVALSKVETQSDSESTNLNISGAKKLSENTMTNRRVSTVMTNRRVSKSKNPDTKLSAAASKQPGCSPQNRISSTHSNEQKRPESGTNKTACEPKIISTVHEKVIQSKKRPRLAEPTYLQDCASKEQLNQKISAYWSGFPVGQSKDCLTNYRYGKSRYPIDYFTPPTIPSNRRSKRHQSSRTQPHTGVASSNVTVSVLPSYVTWRSISLPGTCVSSLVGPRIKQQLNMENESRDRILYSRSLSVDRSKFLYPGEVIRSSNKDARKKSNYSADTSNHHISSTPCNLDEIQHVAPLPFYKRIQGNTALQHCESTRLEPHEGVSHSLRTSTFTATAHHISVLPRGVLIASQGHSSKGNSGEKQDSNTKPETASPVRVGPFHERVRLEAGGNIHSIRRLAAELSENDHIRNTRLQSQNKEPLELTNGKYMIWNAAKEMWYIDNGRNNNCNLTDTGEIAQGNGVSFPKKTCVNGDEINQHFQCAEKSGDESSSHSRVDDMDDLNVSLSDVEYLLSSTVSSFRMLRTCLSKADMEANTNNNCKEDEANIDRKPVQGAHSGNRKLADELCSVRSVESDRNTSVSTVNRDCKQPVYPSDRNTSLSTVNRDFKQPVYPSYGAMIKDEPVKKNILLRETLKENFSLIQEISRCVCTCMDVIMTSRPGGQIHYKKYLIKKYIESVKHCPLHSEDTLKRHQREMSNLFQCLPCPAQHKRSDDQTNKYKSKGKRTDRRKGKGKGKARKAKDVTSPGCSWFSERESRDRNSLKDQCLLAAAKDYLAAYVNQHYKKEFLGRHQLEAENAPDGDHLFKDFFAFIERLPHKATNKDSHELHGKAKAAMSGAIVEEGIVDRQVKRQLRSQGSVVTQQELFLQILKKSQQKVNDSNTDNKGSSESLMKDGVESSSSGDGKMNETKSHIEKNTSHYQSKYDASSFPVITNGIIQVKEEVHTTQWTGEDKHVTKFSLDDISYDEQFSNAHADVSYYGMAYVYRLSLPYVIDNGYKYLHVKEAARLLPRCCCSIIRSILKQDPSLVRTLCTWEQVGMLDSLGTSRNKTVVRTGDILIRLDTLITHLADLEDVLKTRHQQRPRSHVACLY